MEKDTLSPNIIEAIELILARGNSAEVKKRKGEIIVLEEERHIKGKQSL